uniref:Uncharacterized protein n=1 Tax=Enterococcus phage PMBT56 TaxID=3229530 RepID=A0AB39C682_9CAUD
MDSRAPRPPSEKLPPALPKDPRQPWPRLRPCAFPHASRGVASASRRSHVTPSDTLTQATSLRLCLFAVNIALSQGLSTLNNVYYVN